MKLKCLNSFGIPIHRNYTQHPHVELRCESGSSMTVREVKLLCKQGQLKEALAILYSMGKENTAAVNSDALFCLLQACANLKVLAEEVRYAAGHLYVSERF